MKLPHLLFPALVIASTGFAIVPPAQSEKPKPASAAKGSGIPQCVVAVDKDLTLRRTEVKHDPGSALSWVIRKDGRVVLERNARDEMAYQFVGNAQPGVYTVYLHQFVDGAYRVISNVVSYEVPDEAKGKAKPACHLYLVSDRMVNRSLVEDELDADLTWQVLLDGSQVLARNAKNQTQFRYFGAKPGKYEISVLRDGKRISNVIRYTIK